VSMSSASCSSWHRLNLRLLRLLLAPGLFDLGCLAAAAEGVSQDSSTNLSQSEMMWNWSGCNAKSLCECKLHGQVGGVKGTDVASECFDNGYAKPKVDQLYRLDEALANHKF
ncbi:unnamed protein product, partial [Polarella glacialis]